MLRPSQPRPLSTQEWVDETVAEVLAWSPKRVVEMGCGKGMIAFRVAANPCVTEFVACDLSRLATEYVERVFHSHVATGGGTSPGSSSEASGVTCSLSTHVRDASNFAGLADATFDAVVVNGVSMYFPSVAYLVDTLCAGLPKLVAASGKYHFGDVISREHYKLFLLRRARFFTHSFEELRSTEVRAGVQPATLRVRGCNRRKGGCNRMSQVREALIASGKDRCFEAELFYALQLAGRLRGVAGVEMQLKHGEIMSEFGRYRYNVILHLGPPPAAPLALVSVPGGDACSGARASATTLAAALAALAAASPRAVVACHGILNARLSADALLASGAEDAPAPAVEVGVGVAGGVDPAALRAALRAALPTHHVVLQWARDGTAEHMDVYALPSAEGGTDELIADEPTMLAAGLAAVMISACEVVGQAALVERAGNEAGLESFTNKLASVDDTAPGGGGGGEVLMHEARTLWADEAGGAQAKHAAVLSLLGAVLGMPAPAPPSESFATNGGNSFVAMQAIGAVRAELGVGVPVFELLTKTFGAFADAVLAKAGGQDTPDARSWVVAVDESAPQQGRAAAQSAPTFVFFPQAGSSPKQYAAVFTELRKSVERGRYLFVQVM